MIKLLHILYSGQGGLGSYFMNFVRSDTQRNFSHVAYFYGVEPLNEEYKQFCLSKGIEYKSRIRKGKLDLAALRDLSAYASKQSVDYLMLHTFSMTPVLAISWYKKWKVISVDHTSHAFKTKREKIWTICNFIFAKSMVFFYKSQFKPIQQMLPFLRPGRNSFVIPKSVNLEFYSRQPENKDQHSFILGMASRLTPGKRHDLLLRAISLHLLSDKKVKLKLAGGGPLSEQLKEESKSLGIEDQVEFCGSLDQNELVEFYYSLNAYIHVSDGETICYSIMEAQACRLPVLASNVIGINTVLKQKENALLFENDPREIANLIAEIIQSDTLTEVLAARSHALAVQNSSRNNPSEILFTLLSSN